MPIDRDALASAFDQLKSRPFPGHPDDPDLAEWVLELTELDGHIAGLAATALGSGLAQVLSVHEVADHARRLDDIRVVGDDEGIYEVCAAYVHALQRVEDALCGRASSAN